MAVYFAERDGLIKIGCSDSPKVRVGALHARLLAVIPGRYPEERQIHNRFAADRVDGEWFRPSAELVAFIAQPDVAYEPRDTVLMTVGEVAEFYRVHPRTVLNWVKRGWLTPAFSGGLVRPRRYFWRAQILEGRAA